MESFRCPLCEKDSDCNKQMAGENGYVQYNCSTYHASFFLADSIINMSRENEDKEKVLDLVTEQLVHNTAYKGKDKESNHMHFYYQSLSESDDDKPRYYINVAKLLKGYPVNTLDKLNRGLLNLSYYYPHYGDIIEINRENGRLIFDRYDNNSFGIHGFVDLFEDMNYIKRPSRGSTRYTLSALGWQKIDELRRKELVRKQGFIAMRFGDETKNIREAFRKAINECGYNERFIDEKEHNNQIVPEILFEIERSKFMGVDVTYPNYGAYYEAGYAQALNKQVIICCRKEEFDSLEKKPHFDIAQKSMIVWTDENDLVERLERRIEATVK